MNLLQVVKMSDEVTVSSLPHPISMFFLGIYLVAMIYMLVEVNRFKKDNDKMKKFLETFEKRISDLKFESDSKMSEISKKIDSRVDKALLSFKKTNKIQD